jgi:glyoxylase-like metal-dependent hydrolase (beta-lactamase superfamily II)
MAQVKVLIEGTHKVTGEGKMDIGSTTTLIKSDINIIVDPGSLVNKDRLVSALKKEGLEPENIDAVILTHLHIDHVLNVYLFDQAMVFLRFMGGSSYPGMFQKLSEGTLQRFDLFHDVIAKDLEIIETQGHAIDGITVLVKTEEGLVAIAGDAISDEGWLDLNKKPDPNICYDVDKYEESRSKIIKIADFIVPGHGGIIKISE